MRSGRSPTRHMLQDHKVPHLPSTVVQRHEALMNIIRGPCRDRQTGCDWVRADQHGTWVTSISRTAPPAKRPYPSSPFRTCANGLLRDVVTEIDETGWEDPLPARG